MNGVSTITVTEDIALVTIDSAPNRVDVIAHIFSAFGGAEIDLDMISQTAPRGDQVSLSFTVAGSDSVKVLSLLKDFSQRHGGLRPLIRSDNCKILLAGEEMRGRPGVTARAVSALAEAGAELSLITTAEAEISLLVPSAHLDSSLDALEKVFSVRPL